MNIKVLSSGHRMPTWLQEGMAIYQKRLPRSYVLMQHHLQHAGPAPVVKKIERLLKTKIESSDVVVALDECGDVLSSNDWGKHFMQWGEQSQNAAFIIGGADGLLPVQRKCAHLTWSLSALTFPHHMVQLVLIEQIYRAVCYCQGHPYPR